MQRDLAWAAVELLGAHVLGHLARLPAALRDPLGGSRWRLLLVATAVAVGAIAAAAVYPNAAAWLHWVHAFHRDG